MPCRAVSFAALCLVTVALLTARPAAAACDTTANASSLSQARTAIDEACPCAAATSPGAHAKCAKVVVAARVANAQLVKSCKGEALKHATKSICGRPGAVVCCRTKPGKTSHKIAGSAAKCTSTPALTACVSLLSSIDTGCDTMGCVAPVCGNGVVEPSETCDPPYGVDCDDTCQLATCEPPVTTCGNGTVEFGESCEPAGAGACGWDCQPTSCAPASPGEIDVACVDGTATVGVGSRGTDYLLTWSGNVYRAGADIIGRRFDVNGAPLDVGARVVSTGVHCAGDVFKPSVAGNADRYVLAWEAATPKFVPVVYRSIYTRSYENDGTVGTLGEAAIALTGAGMCQSSVRGPTAVAPVPAAGPHAFAALWEEGYGCVGFPFGFQLAGQLIDYPSVTPVTTGLTLGGVTAGLASLGSDTLLAWHTDSPGLKVAGTWLAGDGSSSNLILSSRTAGAGGLRPAVTAATDRFLVAWAQGPVDDATEIRGMRVTHAGGALDADGGILLATTAGGKVVAGPVAAFDGTVWLVAWSEVGGGGNDLRAVAVQTDGTVVDATPRLIASGLNDAAISLASAGDGRALVMYVRPDGASAAVRAQLVPGT